MKNRLLKAEIKRLKKKHPKITDKHAEKLAKLNIELLVMPKLSMKDFKVISFGDSTLSKRYKSKLFSK